MASCRSSSTRSTRGLRPHARHPDADRRDDRADRRRASAPATSTSTATSIGAVVGVQPFGGDGLSGTGPKAGGPHYLRRLVRAARATAAPARSRTRRAARSDRRVEHAVRPAARARRVHRRDGGGPARAGTLRRGTRQYRDRAAGRGGRARARRASARAAKSPPIRSPRGRTPCCSPATRPRRPRCGARWPTRRARSCRWSWRATAATTRTRLLVERTVTVNTTASGGNASLLSLDEAEPA